MDIEAYLANVCDREFLQDNSGMHDYFNGLSVDAETARFAQEMMELEREALNELPPIYVTVPLPSYT